MISRSMTKDLPEEKIAVVAAAKGGWKKPIKAI